MKAFVEKDGCISCGLCVGICSEVFQMGDDGLAEPISENVPKGAEACAVEAQESCPVSVIKVEE